MGIRFASVRHSDVVVMAPALTETAQTQSFNFATSPSRSPSLSLKNHTKKKSLILREELQKKSLSNGLNHFSGMNGHSPTKTTYSINGLAKNLKNEFLPLNKKNEETDAKNKAEANYNITQIGGYIMTSGYMGDPDMGLQKSNKELSDSEKISPEVDQILKNFGEMNNDDHITMNNEELNSHPDMQVDDIIKAISNFDNNPNEIEVGPSGDIENIFENGLFNEADIMNMCVDDSLVTVNTEVLACDKINDIRKKHFQLERKLAFLLRRLKKTEVYLLGTHAAEEITGAIEYSTNLMEAFSRSKGYPSGEQDSSDVRCEVKPTTYSNMSMFMRQMDHAVNQQTNTVARNNAIRHCKYFGSGSSSNSLISTSNGVRSSLPGSVLPPYPSNVKQNIEMFSGELKAQLVKIQQDIDSDVTDSSSGWESSDEFVTYNNAYQHPLSISKRASWRWAEDRAMLAAKWTWLQSQIADLEYRIRQQTDIKKNIRATKGSLRFQEEPSPSPQSLPNGCNGEKGGDGSCSRTRGLLKNTFTKRKLLLLNGLHRTSKRAGRNATIRCSCSSPVPGCGLCTGRLEPGQPSEPMSTLPVNQRVAYLDPGFHPILSLPQDVSTSIHYDAVMKCTDWQSRASRIQGKASSSSLPTVTDEKSRGRLPPTNESTVVDLQRSKAAALAVSVKLRRRLVRGKRRRRNNLLTLDRYRHRRKHSTGLSGGDSEDAVDGQDADSTANLSRYPSPVPSPSSSSTLAAPVSKDKETSIKRKRENSYDIDNIVIPYSMASATRLEKLTYKEILTPKWRHVKESAEDGELKNGIIRRSSHENMEQDEDNSDEAALARHERCQIEEKRKFLSYLKLPGGLRGRAQRRTDSRADSSGPNTPEGMSPRDDGPSTSEDPPSIRSPPQNCDTNAETGRKRTISNSYQLVPVVSEVPPYEPRIFPLTDEDYQRMLEQNDDHHYPPVLNSSYQGESAVAPPSPNSVSTDSADSFLGEDPNDPEWRSSADRSNCKR